VTQWDIIDILKANRRNWLTTGEIAKIAGRPHGQLYQPLMKLRVSKLIHFATRTGKGNQLYIYKYRELKK